MPTVIEQLQSQCLTPAVLNEIRVEKYMQVAAQMYALALEPNALTVRYVALKKFLGFMTKLYAHNGYTSAAVRKERLYFERSMRTSLAELEKIVAAINAAEADANANAAAAASAAPALSSAPQTLPAHMKLALGPGRPRLSAHDLAKEEQLFDEFEESDECEEQKGGNIRQTGNHSTLPTVLSPATPATIHLVPTISPAPAAVRAPDTKRAFDRLRVPDSVFEPSLPKLCLDLPYVPINSTLPTQATPGLDAYSEFAAIAGYATDNYMSASRLGLPAYCVPQATSDSSAELTGSSVLAGVSKTDVEIVRAIGDDYFHADTGKPYQSWLQFPAPSPAPLSAMSVSVQSPVGLWYIRDDFYVNYNALLASLPPMLQMTRSAVESNRCFFLHLGVALCLNPFILQVSFRHFGSLLMQDTAAEDFSLREDILQSVLNYCDFVDANCLIWLWMQEFAPYRCVVLVTLHIRCVLRDPRIVPKYLRPLFPNQSLPTYPTFICET